VTDIEVVYFAHPLGNDCEGNAARARRWLRWLMDCAPGYAFCCPWLPFVDVATAEELAGNGVVEGDRMHSYRARAFRDDLAIARRCDGIVLCGEKVSPGMRGEAEAVVAAGGWVADLTMFRETLMTKTEWAPSDSPIALGRRMWSGRL
jgi:hypothetical protein